MPILRNPAVQTPEFCVHNESPIDTEVSYVQLVGNVLTVVATTTIEEEPADAPTVYNFLIDDDLKDRINSSGSVDLTWVLIFNGTLDDIEPDVNLYEELVEEAGTHTLTLEIDC